jgi:hypothetical protein
MRHLWVSLLILGAGLLIEAAPAEDVQLVLSLTKSPAEYRVSEPILFEVALSSQSPRQYFASRSGFGSGPYSGIAVELTPTEGTDDLQARNRSDFFAGSVLSSPPRYLNEEPISASVDLTGWFRFKKPGHYKFSVVSRQVSRVAHLGQGMSGEAIKVRSNVVEFDILPTDEVSEAQEQEELFRELDGSSGLTLTEHRLVLLDTPQVIQEVVRRRLETARSLSENSTFLLI